MKIARIPRRRVRVKHDDLTMVRRKLMTKLNLLKEEGLVKVTTTRRSLTIVRCSAAIVKNLGILLMNVGTRKTNRMMVK
jgi:DNA-binding transcriptional regulator LsrR (DeoR family)